MLLIEYSAFPVVGQSIKIEHESFLVNPDESALGRHDKEVQANVRDAAVSEVVRRKDALGDFLERPTYAAKVEPDAGQVVAIRDAADDHLPKLWREIRCAASLHIGRHRVHGAAEKLARRSTWAPQFEKTCEG